MKIRRYTKCEKSDKTDKTEKRKEIAVRPRYFVFCEKKTGSVRFQVPASEDGSLPVEESANLMAMHCLARQETPSDFQVLFAADEEFHAGVAVRAQQLVQGVSNANTQIHLTRREQEVLEGVLQNLANKEIAAKLNLSERTVKFHVSSLLAKFGVQRRLGLLTKAANALFPRSIFHNPAAPSWDLGRALANVNPLPN